MLSKLIILIIKIYKIGFSPIFSHCCRFRPTCSEYTIQAIQTHGLLYGLFLGIKRIAKCNPLGPSGFDPIPPGKNLNI